MSNIIFTIHFKEEVCIHLINDHGFFYFLKIFTVRRLPGEGSQKFFRMVPGPLTRVRVKISMIDIFQLHDNEVLHTNKKFMGVQVNITNISYAKTWLGIRIYTGEHAQL